MLERLTKGSWRALYGAWLSFRIPFVRQLEAADCGSACLAMLVRLNGGRMALHRLRQLSDTGLNGASLAGLRDAAKAAGFKPRMLDLTYERLADSVRLPCIAHLQGNHFVLVWRVAADGAWIVDPATGVSFLPRGKFLGQWRRGEAAGRGAVLEAAPERKPEDDGSGGREVRYLGGIVGKLSAYWEVLVQMVIGILAVGLLQLALPFIIRVVVDRGISASDVPLVALLVGGYAALALGAFVTDLVKNEIFIFVGRMINLFALREFALKLMRLPLWFFERKKSGDILRRMDDIKRIENFMGLSLVGSVFSALMLVSMSALLFVYSPRVFAIFMLVSGLQAAWMLALIKKQKAADSLMFQGSSESFTATMNMIRGLPDIKVNLAESRMLDEWAAQQKMVYDADTVRLRLMAFMRAGSSFFGALRSAVVTGFAAVSVIRGELTLGQLLAVQYVVGYLGGTMESFLHFLSSFNETKLSVERLVDVNDSEEERHSGPALPDLPGPADIVLDGLGYKYNRYGPVTLDSVSCGFDKGLTYAVVGSSGSGKTTLLKILAGLYAPCSGRMLVGGTDLAGLNIRHWRSKCAVVLQDGYVFPGTVLDNISLSSEQPDLAAAKAAAEAAMLSEQLGQLPDTYAFRLGAEGVGFSQGQRQRLLLARAIYKKPDYMLLDEATSALDSETEEGVFLRLRAALPGKTIIYVTHHIATTRLADKVLVMDKGRVAEFGSPAELFAAGGLYRRFCDFSGVSVP